jgi:hypothetical protein
MMPRAANLFADQQTLVKGSLVVSTESSDRKEFITPTNKKDRLVFGISSQHRSVSDL